MNTSLHEISPHAIDLSLEMRFANGSSAEFHASEEERVREALALLAPPRLFAQPHLLLASNHCASMIPCKGIDMIIARTSAPLPVKFPLNLPAGVFDIVEQPDAWPGSESIASEDQGGGPRQRNSQLEILTLGGWTVTLEALAEFRGMVQDERQFFSQLPTIPSIPFRLKKGGFGLINPGNIIRVSAWPRPEMLPASVLPLALRR